MKRRTAWSGAAIALFSAALGLTGCSSSGGSSTSSGALSGETPAQVKAAALSAAHRFGSFHFVDRVGQGKDSGRLLVGDAGPADGQQTLTSPKTSLDVRLVGGIAYVRAGQAVLVTVLGLPGAVANQNEGKWISVTSADPGYTQIVDSLSPASELGAYIPQGTLSLGAPTKIGGVPVVPVSGGALPQISAGLKDARATLFVRAASPHVPAGGTITGIGTDGHRQIEAVIFKGWGETIRPQVPAGAIPAETLP
jgi:hypothetical protein